MGDGVVMQNGIGQRDGVRRAWQPYMVLSVSFMCVLQVLRYFDYVFTGVFTFEMVIKVKIFQRKPGLWIPVIPLVCFKALPPSCHLLVHGSVKRASAEPSPASVSLLKEGMAVWM